MMGYYELALYVLLEDDTPEMIDVMMTASKEESLNLAHQIACKLNEKQYFEIFNDESQETIYVLKDGEEIKDFKMLIANL